jgi:hypothetical protein
LDRSSDGPRGRHLAALGAAHLSGPPASAASSAELQANRWQHGLPVFLIGGGSLSQIHKDTALGLDFWLKQNGQGGARVLALPSPEGLLYECDRQSLHRLSVAVGLSLPFVDIPKVLLPRVIEDQLSPQRIIDDRYISRDDV